MLKIGPISQFHSHPYKGRLSEFVGMRGERALKFSDKYLVSKWVQSRELVSHGRDHKLREFRARLYEESDSEDEEVAFYLDLEEERKYTELLKNSGVIKDLPNWKRKASLISHLVKNGAVAAAMAPLTLPAGAFAIFGRMATLGKMGVATYVQSKTHTEWDGESSISFFTMNIAGTPLTTMNEHNLMPPNNFRVRKVVEKVKESDVDIVCFQEAFDLDLMTDMAKELRKDGWSSVYGSKFGGVFKLGSGLFAATRIGTMECVGFREYDNLVSWDKDSAKGVLVLVIQINDDTKIAVATTHMQAGYPKGWSLGDKIENKTAEFHHARDFIEKVITDMDVDDVFFMGDFNVSRFDQKGDSLYKVVKNPMYEAMVDGLLRPTETQNGYKAFTIPNRKDSPEDYLKKEIDFKPIPKSEERGIAAGTCYNSAATSFHNADDIAAVQLKDEVGDLSFKQAKKMVVRHLAGKSIKRPEYAEIIDQIVHNIKVYVKSNTVDQFAQQVNEHRRFKLVKYQYVTVSYMGRKGPVSDHRGLKVTVKPG